MKTGSGLRASDFGQSAWVVVAHVLGASTIVAVDAGRLQSVGIGFAAIPIAAVVGLIAGTIGLAQRTWVVAAATMIVTAPVCWTLFDGAYAQTLPGARVAPFALPPLLAAIAAGALWGGRRLMGDLVNRAMLVMAVAAVLGGIVWAERHVLRGGYPIAHIGATLAVCVLAGVAVRIAWKGSLPSVVAGCVAVIAIAAMTVAAIDSLRDRADRELLAYGDQTRDLVRLARWVIDADRDGSSPAFGGGDCDDFDPSKHPGAMDIPSDGIDQDCDGADATRIVVTLPPPKPEARSPKPVTIVLLTVDALRYDLLAPGAPDRDDFPRITRLLEQSVWFTHAVAPASGTDVSLSTLLTGRDDPYQPVARTLIEAMRALGYRTYAAVPGEVTRYVGEVLLERGVQHFTTIKTDGAVADVGDHVSAGATTDVGLHALTDGTGPALIWLHYFDVHEHRQIEVERALLDAVHRGGSPTVHRYRALLHAIDTEIGRLLDALDAEQTIVVFASDHGESLGEDPRLLETHGFVAYAPLVRIPLAIRIPGVAPGQRTELVSLVDIAPTLVHLVGADMTPLDGSDLLAAPAERAIAIHEEQQWSAVEWPYQLIVRPAENLVELYDLDRDPEEHADLSRAHPEVIARLKSQFARFPAVVVDRTPNGRSFRERQAQPPRAPATP